MSFNLSYACQRKNCVVCFKGPEKCQKCKEPDIKSIPSEHVHCNCICHGLNSNNLSAYWD